MPPFKFCHANMAAALKEGFGVPRDGTDELRRHLLHVGPVVTVPEFASVNRVSSEERCA